MNHSEPILSVIIPLFNTDQFIEECILSIVRNDVDPGLFEVIVVDDGSTDSSAAIVKRLTEEYHNIRLIQQENQGVSVARTTGVSNAKGAFIWFIDSDDWLLDGAMSRIMGILESVSDDIDSIHAPLRIYRDGKEDKLSTPLYFADGSTLSGIELLKSGHVSVCPPEFVFRKILFDHPLVYFPEKTRHEDEYFCRTLQYCCRSILQLNEPFYAYRQHGSSFMYSGGIQSLQGLVTIYRHLTSFADMQVKEKDGNWFRKENLALLTATHFWFPHLIGTPDFQSFRKQHGAYIISEFKKYRYLLNRKDRLVGWITLRMPFLYKWRFAIQSKARMLCKAHRDR